MNIQFRNPYQNLETRNGLASSNANSKPVPKNDLISLMQYVSTCVQSMQCDRTQFNIPH